MSLAKFTRNCAAISVLLLVGCKEPDAPPVVEGKCVPSRFEGARATNQTCLFKGYTYVCVYRTNLGANECTNMGEAVAEKPKQ